MRCKSSDRRFFLRGKRSDGRLRGCKIGCGLSELRMGFGEFGADALGGGLNLRHVLLERCVFGCELSNARFETDDLFVCFSDVEKFESCHSTLRGKST